MSVVKVDVIPIKERSIEVKRELLNADIRTIIRERISNCRLDNFPFAMNNVQSVRYHINRSIHDVTYAVVHNVLFRTEAFSVYVDREDEDMIVPYISFDPEKWDQEVAEYMNKASKGGNDYGS